MVKVNLHNKNFKAVLSIAINAILLSSCAYKGGKEAYNTCFSEGHFIPFPGYEDNYFLDVTKIDDETLVDDINFVQDAFSENNQWFYIKLYKIVNNKEVQINFNNLRLTNERLAFKPIYEDNNGFKIIVGYFRNCDSPFLVYTVVFLEDDCIKRLEFGGE